MYTFNIIRKAWSPQDPAGSFTLENSPDNTTNIWTSLTRIQYWCLEKSNPRIEQQTNSWVLFVNVERWFEHTFKLGENKKDLKPSVCLKEENRNSSIYHIYVLPFLILVHRIWMIQRKWLLMDHLIFFLQVYHHL